MNILFFLIFVIIIGQTKEINAATVRISGNITDFRNNNEREIECSFTGIISSIVLLAKNKSSGTFESIAFSNDNKNFTLTEFGNSIFENVTTSIKPGSKSIIFNGLSCLQVREYQCQIWILKFGGGFEQIESTVMHINVKIRPSKPELSFNTLDQNENSTNSSTNKTKFKRSSSLISNRSINKRAFNEGDSITFKCDGDVGRPKGNFIWQKIYSTKRIFNYTSIPTETTPENCTFSGTSNLTIQVTAEDNLANIRCIVKSDVSEVEMSADSEPLLIYFHVREPYISVEPNETVYKEGESVQLNCKGYGNPYPSYSWTKGNRSDDTISDNDTLLLQNVTISDNGLFTCNTSNEINGEIYSASRSTDIIIVKVPSAVRINQNITKREHSNGIKLNCSYDIGSQDTFESIALAAQNVTADQFQDTADRRRNTTQTLTAFGVYLFGNDTAVFKSKNALMLEFNNLERRHELLYKCILKVYPRNSPFIPEQIESDVMTITVTAEEITITDSEHKTDIIVVVAVLVPCFGLIVLAVAVVVGIKLRRTRTQASLGLFDDDEKNSQTRDTDSEDNQQGTTMYANPQYDVDDTSSNSRYKKEKNYEQSETAKIITQNKEHQQENDMYADPIDGVYEKLGVKRYKEENNCEQLDTVKNISAESNKSTKSKDITIMLNRSPKSHDKLMSSGYESVDKTGETPVIFSASPANEHDYADVVKQLNEKDMEEDDKINKSHISHNPVEYATLNEATKLKNIKKENHRTQEKGDTCAEIHKGNNERLSTKSDDTKQIKNINAEIHKGIDDRSGQTVDNAEYSNTTMHLGSLTSTEHTKQKENINAKTQEGIEERPGRVVDNAGYFDTTLRLMDQQTNSGQETAKRDDQRKTFTNQAFETEEDQLADDVSSQFRLLDGLQDGGERNQNVD